MITILFAYLRKLFNHKLHFLVCADSNSQEVIYSRLVEISYEDTIFTEVCEDLLCRELFMLCKEKIRFAVKDSYNSYPLDQIAIETAVASLSDEDYFKATVEKVKATRDKNCMSPSQPAYR